MSNKNLVDLNPDFLFGLANASSQVEDDLPDIWSDHGKKNKIKCFKNQNIPEQRIKFWSEPEKELEWAVKSGIKIFRFSLDWHRLFPKNGVDIDQNILDSYQRIFDYLKKHGIKTMVSLFHHSEPAWMMKKGGWTDPMAVQHFINFAIAVVKRFGADIDYLVTFNEPELYILMTKVIGLWPNGKARNPLHFLNFGPIKGGFTRSVDHMIASHKKVYELTKQLHPHIKIGMAQNLGHYLNMNEEQDTIARFIEKRMVMNFYQQTNDHVDYIGVNYYGSEFTSLFGFYFHPRYEYSDSGRAINPTGLYTMIKKVWPQLNKPIFITENGVADEADIFKPLYILEHLKVLAQLMEEGIPIEGYCLWTLSDNLEWADGYGPKFGVLGVDRENEMERKPRESFYFYQKIAKNGGWTSEDEDWAWQRYSSKFGKERPFYRKIDGMYSRHTPVKTILKGIDWRFQCDK